MSYDRNFSRGRGRGRGGFNDSSSRQYNKYEDRSPKDDFLERGLRGSRRPSGTYSRNYSREEYRPREERRNSRDSLERESYRPRESRRDTHDSFGGRERNFGAMRRSPSDYRKEVPRSRPLSPPRKEYNARDIDPRARDYQSRYRSFEVRRSDFRRDFSPVARERRMSPVRYNHDRYEPVPRSQNFDRDQYSDRRRNDLRTSNPHDSRDYRSRSPIMRPRGGGFNGTRGGGGRGRDNFNRFESDQST